MTLDGELWYRALELGEDRAVLVRIEVEAVGGDEPAAAGIVLDDDGRIARDEAREMPPYQPRRNVVDAPRRRAHQHRHGAALVEGLDRLRTRLRCRRRPAAQAAEEKDERRAHGRGHGR